MTNVFKELEKNIFIREMLDDVPSIREIALWCNERVWEILTRSRRGKHESGGDDPNGFRDS
ncbi:MAG: hypothetical protein ACLPVO_05785 [Desulfomonilaceae bacterium]